MFVGKKFCSSCPQSKEDLELIETRFEGGLCFVELRCRYCASCWTAEVAIPETEDVEYAKSRPWLRAPRWHLVNIVAADEATLFGRDLRRPDQTEQLIAAEAG